MKSLSNLHTPVYLGNTTKRWLKITTLSSINFAMQPTFNRRIYFWLTFRGFIFLLNTYEIRREIHRGEVNAIFDHTRLYVRKKLMNRVTYAQLTASLIILSNRWRLLFIVSSGDWKLETSFPRKTESGGRGKGSLFNFTFPEGIHLPPISLAVSAPRPRKSQLNLTSICNT